MNSQILITALISSGAAVIVGFFTYLGIRKKNNADAAKSEADTAISEEDLTNKRLARYEKNIEKLEKEVDAKQAIIDTLNTRIAEKERSERTYLIKIQQLEDKIDELSNQVNQLSVTMSQKIH